MRLHVKAATAATLAIAVSTAAASVSWAPPAGEEPTVIPTPDVVQGNVPGCVEHAVHVLNEFRANLLELCVNPSLQASAQDQAEWMAAVSAVDHRPDTFVRTVSFGYPQHAARSENVGVIVDGLDSCLSPNTKTNIDDLEKSAEYIIRCKFMTSPKGHREHILEPKINQVGIGYAWGIFEGRRAIYWAHNYGISAMNCISNNPRAHQPVVPAPQPQVPGYSVPNEPPMPLGGNPPPSEYFPPSEPIELEVPQVIVHSIPPLPQYGSYFPGQPATHPPGFPETPASNEPPTYKPFTSDDNPQGPGYVWHPGQPHPEIPSDSPTVPAKADKQPPVVNPPTFDTLFPGQPLRQFPSHQPSTPIHWYPVVDPVPQPPAQNIPQPPVIVNEPPTPIPEVAQPPVTLEEPPTPTYEHPVQPAPEPPTYPVVPDNVDPEVPCVIDEIPPAPVTVVTPTRPVRPVPPMEPHVDVPVVHQHISPPEQPAYPVGRAYPTQPPVHVPALPKGNIPKPLVSAPKRKCYRRKVIRKCIKWGKRPSVPASPTDTEPPKPQAKVIQAEPEKPDNVQETPAAPISYGVEYPTSPVLVPDTLMQYDAAPAKDDDSFY